MATVERDARRFGAFLGGLLAVLAAKWSIRNHGAHWGTWTVVALSLAVIVWLLAGLAPRALVPAYERWRRVAAVLGRVQSTLLLTLIFLFVLTPISLLMHFVRRWVRGRRASATTLWHVRSDRPPAYRRLF